MSNEIEMEETLPEFVPAADAASASAPAAGKSASIAPSPSRSRSASPPPASASPSVDKLVLSLAEESGETLRRWKPDQFASAVEGFTRASIAPTVRACRTAGWLEREVILSWRSLRWRKDGLALLNVVSGSLHPGEMVAVMGSRATSLLEVLAGRAAGGRLTGQVLLDGFEPDSSYKRMVGYVPTEDFHLPMLTVRETINFSSRLRARPEVPQRVAEFRTEVIMKMLGLDGVADSPVGNELIRGISGGEKRRLSIAVELAAGHSVLLASKPTNGLDSATAMDLVRKTREMCRGGNAAIYSITQAAPELLNEFDRIMCLSRGTLVYYGPPQEAEAHLLRLGFVRPAEKSVPDFINEVLDTPEVFFDPELAPDVDPRRSLRDHHSLRDHGNGDAVKLDVLPTTYHETWQRLVCGFQESEARAELGRTLWNEMLPHVEVDDEEEPPEPRKYNASLKEQMKEVFRREYLAFVRNEELMGAFFMGAIVLAFTFGITFFDLGDSDADVRGRAGVLFFGIASSPFDTMVFIPALMVDARAVFYQQRKAGYFRAVGYYLTRMLQGLPATALRQLLVTVILYSMVNLRGGPFSEQFFYFYAVTFMVFIISRALTFALVYASPNQTVAQAIVPTVYLIFMLTAGFLLQEDAAPAGWKWFYTINFERSALAGVFINEFVGETGYTCDGPTGSCLFNSGRDVLDFYSFGTDDEDDKYPLLAWLVLFFAIANLIAIASTYLFDYSDAVSIYERASAGPGDMSVLHSSNPGAVKIDTAAVVEFRDLCYDVPVPNPDEEARKATPIVQRRLLKNINGFAKPGRMLCLMGASGAGKSTLLDVLAGKKTGGTLDGDILVNGHAKDEFFGRYSGYVEQNDSIDEFSTVREAIDFSANIRLGPETSDEERRTIVHSVMEELGLTPWANHRIGVPGSAGVPGDIRKKVTTGVELVLRPGILFLDEPTTGLTSADATSVMESVRNLANRITVICTIHQPSQEIVGKFDDILLLQPGGEVVYTGPLDELAAYFRRQGLGEYVEGSNIADFALEALKARSVAIKAAQADGVADDELPPDPAQLWRDSPECAAVNDQLEQGVAAPDAKKPEFDSLFANGFVRQFQLLLQREITIRKRDTYGIGARLGSALFAAILLATLYWRLPVEDFAFTADNNRMSMAAFTVATSCYFAQAVIGGMVGFRPIYFRETTNGMYSTEAFYLARFIADLPVQLAMAFGSSIIVFWATNVSPEDQGENFVLWIVGTVVVQMLGTAVNEFTAAAMPNGELAVNGAVMIFSFSFIFSGFFLVRDSIPVYLIWLYWFNVFTHPIAYFCALAIGDTPNGQTLLDLFSIDPKDKGFYIGLTIVHLLFYRFLAYIALKKINHIKR